VPAGDQEGITELHNRAIIRELSVIPIFVQLLHNEFENIQHVGPACCVSSRPTRRAPP
jgi:hypothetical protein